MEQTVNERIKLIRLESGLGFEDFAKKSGVSRSVLHKIEHKKDYVPTDTTIGKIARAFHTRPIWILDGDGAKTEGEWNHDETTDRLEELYQEVQKNSSEIKSSLDGLTAAIHLLIGKMGKLKASELPGRPLLKMGAYSGAIAA